MKKKYKGIGKIIDKSNRKEHFKKIFHPKKLSVPKPKRCLKLNAAN